MTAYRTIRRLAATLVVLAVMATPTRATDRETDRETGRPVDAASPAATAVPPPMAMPVGLGADTVALPGGSIPLAALTSPPARADDGAGGGELHLQGGGAGPQLRYYALDALGSVRVVFDAAGAVIGRSDYELFGAAVPASTTGTLPRQQFTGQERDGEVGVDYFGARMYAPTSGRMLSVDPLYVGAVDDPQRWNRYGYALQNPLRYTDPDGRQARECNHSEVPVFGADGQFSHMSYTVACGQTSGGGGGGFGAAAFAWIRDRLNTPVGGPEADEWHGAPRWVSQPRVTDADGVNGPESGGNVNEGFDPLVEGISLVATAGGSAGNSAAKIAAREGGQAIAKKASANVPRFVSAPSGTVDMKTALERIGSGVLDPHRRDGTIHRNLEGLLPSGNQYTEWVVRGLGSGAPGANRIVVGSNGSIYFSYDHYGSFTQLAGPR